MFMSEVKQYSLLIEFDVNFFKSGKYFCVYEKLGSYFVEVDGEWGYYFVVWVLSVKVVLVVGDFNKWNCLFYLFFVWMDGLGIWEGFILGLKKGLLYKYVVDSQDGC